MEEIRLTQTVVKGGCAAKLPAGELRGLLGKLDLPQAPELAIGIEAFDDAALWDLGDQYAVQTLDFFTPIVDNAEDFGRIAAANAISDVYAMGGEPKLALSILAFPSKNLPLELIEKLMSGAVETIREAGACLGGGHTIDDDTLKFGLSVMGLVPKNAVWTNAGAQAGDRLILTKALGTGTITSALKNGVAQADWVAAATKSMTQLNQARPLLKGIDVHAAVDVTGFGLAGHALQMAQASKKNFEFQSKELPWISGAQECLDKKVLNRAHKTNAEYVAKHCSYVNVNDSERWLTVDPQTSGGLLLAVPAQQVDAAVTQLSKKFRSTSVIGEVKTAGALSHTLVFQGSG